MKTSKEGLEVNNLYRFQDSPNQTLLHLIAGAISKALATFLTYPYQLLRTNAQIDNFRSEYIRTAKKIFKD